jgi:hypothetical protein
MCGPMGVGAAVVCADWLSLDSIWVAPALLSSAAAAATTATATATTTTKKLKLSLLVVVVVVVVVIAVIIIIIIIITIIMNRNFEVYKVNLHAYFSETEYS